MATGKTAPPPSLAPFSVQLGDGGGDPKGDHSYRVCLACGIKRLFDETKFRARVRTYGYDVKELIARERAARKRQRRKTA